MARLSPDGKRGDGSLYAVGIGYNVTGISYNKKVAAQLGISDPSRPAMLRSISARGRWEALKPTNTVPCQLRVP